MTTLTATVLAYNSSTYLNQVCHQGTTFEIRRGARIVARLSSPAPAEGYLLAALPPLDDAEVSDFHADIESAAAQLAAWRDAWDS